MPPRKKYHTISMCQPGVLSIAASLSAAAEREERAEADRDRRPDRQQGVDDDMALGQPGIRREVVRGRLGQQQEERVQPAEEALAVGAVELGLLEAHGLER